MKLPVHHIKATTKESTYDATTLNELFFVLTLSVLIQILDGMLTSFGISTFGIDIEGNPIVKNLIITFGCKTALCSIKLFAASLSIFICAAMIKKRWAFYAIKGVLLLYIFAAIIPWTAIISEHVMCG